VERKHVKQFNVVSLKMNVFKSRFGLESKSVIKKTPRPSLLVTLLA